jgi:uncharacterized alkaline shock family protein YloU
MDLRQLNDKLMFEANQIDKKAVERAVMKAAMKIFGVMKHKELQQTIDAAIAKAKDTEDAIQIAINMMRE